MNGEADKYRLLFEKMPDAFAYHQVIYNDRGLPVDYLFLEVNSAFETLTGLQREKVIGRKATEVHPEIIDSEFDWIAVYGRVALEGKSIRFEQYFEPAMRWYDVSAFSDIQGFFAVSFREVTLQKSENMALAKLASLAQNILQNPSGVPDYQFFSNGLIELSGAKFTAINVYSEDSKKTTTKAISGVGESIRTICDLLGFELTGNTWDVIPERLKAIKEGRLLHFQNLYDSASGAIPKKLSVVLEKTFGTGEVYLAEIGCEGETIGDLIMFMPKHKTLENPKVVELYATQVGFALMRYQADKALHESRDQYQSLVDNIPGTSYRCLYDQDWTMIYMSSDVDNITGYPSSDFISNKVRSYASVICPDDNQNDQIIRAALEKGETWDIEYRVIHSDGSVRWVHEKSRGVLGEDGEVAYIDGLILDITDRKGAEEALKDSELRHRALVGAIPDLLFRYDSSGIYLDVVVKDEKLLHEKSRRLFEQQALVGKKLADVLPASIVVKMTEGIEKALATGEIVVIEYSYLINGDEYYFEARLAPIGSTEVVSIVRDITIRKNYMAELEHIGLHDQLTGLYNRRYFENELQRLGSSREHPIAVVSADLDGLKLVNDTLGHAEGDRYLQTGSLLLKSALRTSDILARVGGDEFALILPHTTMETGEELIARIRRRIDDYNRDENGLPISISIGLAVSKNSNQPLEETYKKADNAMYDDKLKRGKLARAGIVASLLDSLSARGDLGEGDSDQVIELCERMGQALPLAEKQKADLLLLARVYDLGKVSMPDQLIYKSLKQKSAELTEAEWETVRRHPETGYRIASSSPELVGVADLILRHHEKLDGSGYPLGLKGEGIPLECRVLAVVTAYSAMTHSRPYAKTLKPGEALTELKRCAGSQFDPQVVETFVELMAAD
jgi:diguanylate cyclase (GGDEF)-like protein/PAS domain S-box-containing protein